MMFSRRILLAPFWPAALIVFCTIASCRPKDSIDIPSGSGGSIGSSTGGQGGSGGATGGNTPAGGTTATGGATSGGGAGGGASSTGGTVATGGMSVGGNTAKGGSGGSGGTASAGGSSGAGGTSTIPDAAPPVRIPTPATAGHNFPFPQNRENSRCVYPALYRNEDVQAAYAQWKNDTVTSDGAKGFRRVKRPKEPGLEVNSTVSEGIAYGMIIAVYMDDQALFDDLWQYEQQFLDANGLMNWYIKADGSGLGSNPSGSGAATDADEDMAFALVMADKQWGGKGKLNKNYIDIAKGQIQGVWNNEVYQYKYLKPWPATDLPGINLSYFAPAFYKLFAKVDTANANNWNTLTTTMYGVLNATLNAANGNTDNGLVPAWSDTSGKPNGGAFGATGGASPTNYQYDSCRMPFRIGLDYCWTGDSNAQSYVTKTSKFFSATVGGASKIVDGYDLNGTAHAQYQTGSSAQIQSAAFVGPGGVGAMSSSSYQTFVNDAYGVLVTGKALVGGTYYDDSWMVMSLL
ncbi:MAG TPA: glycosyl hydrolase family 8, partial [Polyangia bacterium]